jgi:hypothetical protein
MKDTIGISRLLPVFLLVLASVAAAQDSERITELIKKDTPVVDVRSYASLNPSGTVCNGTAVDDSALRAAAQAATVNHGVLFIPPGLTCKVTQTIIVTSHLTATGATLTTDRDIIVLQIGDSRQLLANKQISLPDVTNLAKNYWSGSISTAVKLVNLYQCRVYGGHNTRFLKGTVVAAANTYGTAYNTIFIGHEEDSKFDYVLQADDSTGWINSNTFIGGRLHMDGNEEAAPPLKGTLVAGSPVVTHVQASSTTLAQYAEKLVIASPLQAPTPVLPLRTTVRSVDAAGGRLTLSANAKFSGAVDLIFPAPESRQLLLAYVPGGNMINNNQFIGTTVEGDSSEYQVELQGAVHNTFIALRWESSAPRLKLTSYTGAATTKNDFQNGFQLDQVQVMDDALTGPNELQTPANRTIYGAGTTGVLVLGNEYSSLSPAITIMPAAASPFSVNQATDWTARISALALSGKWTTDAYDKVKIGFADGSLAFGNGTREIQTPPSTYIRADGPSASDIGIYGGNFYLHSSAFNGPHLVFDQKHVWFDDGGHLRYKASAPTQARDGSIVNSDIAGGLYDTAGNLKTAAHMVRGTGNLTAGTPSTLRVSLAHLAAFSGSADYSCTAQDNTAQHGLKINNISGAQFVITGPDHANDAISFICVGN